MVKTNETEAARKETFLHDAFVIGIVIKGVDSVLEMIGGLCLLLISPQFLNRFVLSLISHELSEDPGDYVTHLLIHLARGWSVSSQLFAGLYLLSHGIAKLGIVIVLLKGKIWAYHAGILFFLLFIVYQLYRYAHTHSIWLIVLSVFDVAVIWLTWMDYRRVKRAGIFENKSDGAETGSGRPQ
jgi:uncharacterized membrane protein